MAYGYEYQHNSNEWINEKITTKAIAAIQIR